MISLLLHETEDEARGGVLITMISYIRVLVAYILLTVFDHNNYSKLFIDQLNGFHPIARL